MLFHVIEIEDTKVAPGVVILKVLFPGNKRINFLSINKEYLSVFALFNVLTAVPREQLKVNKVPDIAEADDNPIALLESVVLIISPPETHTPDDVVTAIVG